MKTVTAARWGRTISKLFKNESGAFDFQKLMRGLGRGVRMIYQEIGKDFYPILKPILKWVTRKGPGLAFMQNYIAARTAGSGVAGGIGRGLWRTASGFGVSTVGAGVRGTKAAWTAARAAGHGAISARAIAGFRGARAGIGAGMAALGLSNPLGWTLTILSATTAVAKFTEALYKSQEHLKEFSGGMARVFMRSEVAGFKRDLASAKNRETVSGWLQWNTDTLKDQLRPLWDFLYNVLGAILSGLMLLVNAVVWVIAKPIQLIYDLIKWIWDSLPNWITGKKKFEGNDDDFGPFGNLLREFGHGRSDKWQEKALFNWGGL